MEYTKSAEDAAKEEQDLKNDPIMLFLKHRENMAFNIGDILVKQNKGWGDDAEWKTETVSPSNAPRKYMYAFENELGVGYLKTLKVDGSGFTSVLTCVSSINPAHSRFVLDPEFVDHMILGGDEKFAYDDEYQAKKKFRDKAIKENKKHLIKMDDPTIQTTWFDSLKVGDVFWMGYCHDDMVDNLYTVKSISSSSLQNATSYWKENLLKRGFALPKKYITITTELKSKRYDSVYSYEYNLGDFTNKKVTLVQPYPLKDELCGQQK